MVVRQSNRKEPVFCNLLIALDMNVNGLAAIIGKEEKAVWATLENRRTHNRRRWHRRPFYVNEASCSKLSSSTSGRDSVSEALPSQRPY